MLAEIKGLNEECGVFGIWGHPECSTNYVLRVHALQHRGQEGAGIVVTDGEVVISAVKGEGLVTEVFTTEVMLEELKLERLQLDMFAMQQLVEVDMKMFSHLFSIFKLEVLRLLIMEI